MVITHSGIDNQGNAVGRIYLGDIGRRPGLGSEKSVYDQGQDRYISPGETITLVDTGEVALSVSKGILKYFLDMGVLVDTGAQSTEFNSLLSKLDADSHVSFTDYAATLFSTGSNTATQFAALLVKLDADTGVTDTNYSSLGAFSTTTFNALLNKLDLDTGVTDTNYYSTLHL